MRKSVLGMLVVVGLLSFLQIGVALDHNNMSIKILQTKQIKELNIGEGVEFVDPIFLAAGETQRVDNIGEVTSGAGVTIDGTQIKDNEIKDASAATSLWSGSYLFAKPGTAYTYFDDFFKAGYVADAATTNIDTKTIAQGGKFSEVADNAEWLVTVIDSGGDNDESIVATDNASGGWITWTTTDAAGDSLSCQKNGESFHVTNSKIIHFEASYEISDVSEVASFVGLHIADTTITNEAGTDFAGFWTDESGVCNFIMAKNGVYSTNATIATFTDADAAVGADKQTLGFRMTGSTSNVIIFVDEVAVATNSTIATFPDDEWFTPSLWIDGTDAAADFLRTDFIKAQVSPR